MIRLTSHLSVTLGWWIRLGKCWETLVIYFNKKRTQMIIAVWARHVLVWYLFEHSEGLLQSLPGLHYWCLLVTRLYPIWVEEVSFFCMRCTLVDFGVIAASLVLVHWELKSNNQSLITWIFCSNSLTRVQTNPCCPLLRDLSVPNTTSLLNSLFSTQRNIMVPHGLLE